MPEAIAWDDLHLPEAHSILAVRECCPDARPQRFTDGDLVVDATDPSRDCVLLVHGGCLVEAPGLDTARRPGNEMAIVEATPDAPVFVGEMASLVEGVDRLASVRSAMTSRGIRLSPGDLAIIMEQLPGLTRVLCRALSERLREVSLQLRHFRNDFALGFTPAFLNPGERLFELGAPAETLWQIAQGSVTLQAAATASVICAEGDEPCFLDLAAYLEGGVHTATAVAQDAVVALRIPQESRLAVVRNFPEHVLRSSTT
jgi:CRP-like cAMP-binding protein